MFVFEDTINDNRGMYKRMKRLRRVDTLFVRLGIVAALPLVIIAVVGFVGYRSVVVPRALATRLAELESASGANATMAETWIEEHRGLLRYLANTGISPDTDADVLLSELRTVIASFPHFRAVVVADADGNVVVDSIHESGGYVGDRAYFLGAANGDSVVTFLKETRTSARPMVVIAEPLRTGPAGVIFAVIDPKSLYQALQFESESNQIDTYIVDGTAIVSGVDAGTPLDRVALTPEETTQMYRNHEGTDVYGVATAINGTPWHAVTEIDTATVAEQFATYNLWLLEAVVITFTAAIIAAILIAATIRKPLYDLLTLSDDLERGVESATAIKPIRFAPREIRRLYHTLYEMARRISARTRELHKTNELLADTQMIAHLGSWEFFPARRTLRCSAEVYRIIGTEDALGELRVNSLLSAITPDDRRRFLTDFTTAVRDFASNFELDLRIARRDTAQERIVHQRCRLEYDHVGRLVRAIGMVHDITDRWVVAQSLRDALNEKSILLRELNHRVRNNLSVVQSILSLQRQSVPPRSHAEDVLTDAYHRISSMAMVHHQLFDGETVGWIDFADYTALLLAEVQAGYGRTDIAVEHRLPQLRLDITLAVPVGMIINELVVNALKHAFRDRPGTITVSAVLLDTGYAPDDDTGLVELSVADDGIGHMTDRDAAEDHAHDETAEHRGTGNTGVGKRLIEQLVAQIDGSLRYETTGGTRVIVRFPINRGESYPA